MLTALAVSSITDIILACFTFFLAGLSCRADMARGSPAWFWSATLLLIGTATMLGAIDHGFFEPIDHQSRWWMVTGTRLTIVLGSFVMLIATVMQFLSAKARWPIVGIGAAAGVGVIGSILTSDNFLWVMAYYGAALMLLLTLSAINLRSWPGARWMIAGIVIALVASVLVVVGFEGFLGLGVYGTYHVILLPSVAFLYLGGRAMRRVVS